MGAGAALFACGECVAGDGPRKGAAMARRRIEGEADAAGTSGTEGTVTALDARGARATELVGLAAAAIDEVVTLAGARPYVSPPAVVGDSRGGSLWMEGQPGSAFENAALPPLSAGNASSAETVTVVWGEELFSPQRFHTFTAGPFTATGRVREGETTTMAMARLLGEVTVVAEQERARKIASYMRMVESTQARRD